jgi:hypothetical protein
MARFKQRSLTMPTDLLWFVENGIVYGHGQGINNVSDLQKLNNEALCYLEQSSSQRLHFLFDLRDICQQPPLMVQAKLYSYVRHPRCGWQVFVGPNDRSQQVTVCVVAELTSMRFRCFDRMAEALEFLEIVEPTLPDLKQAVRAKLTRYVDGAMFDTWMGNKSTATR